MPKYKQLNQNNPPGHYQCTVCEEIKSVDEFVKCNSHKFGHLATCKKCHSDNTRARRERPEVKEKYKQHSVEYNNRKEVKDRRREYAKSEAVKAKEKEKRERLAAERISANLPSLTPHQEGYVYVFQWQSFIKIGRTKDVKRRVRNINGFFPVRGKLIHTIQTNNMARCEFEIHEKYKASRLNGEWFTLTETDIRSIIEIKSAIYK